MSRLFSRSLVCLALVLGCGSAAIAPPQAIAAADSKAMIVSRPTSADDAKLAKGEIVTYLVPRHPVYHLDVYGMVEAPFDAVWNAATSYNNYKDFLPLVVESYVKKRDGKTVHQFVRMQPPWPLHDHWMTNIHVEDRRNGMLPWTMGESNLRFERGYWKITPVTPSRTMLQYHLSVDPWLDIVPTWLFDFATRQVLPDVVKGVRKRVAKK